MNQLLSNNRKHFAYLSGYSLNIITESNYTQHLSKTATKLVKEQLDRARLLNIQREEVEEWVKTIIMTQILQQHGGVAILNSDYMLTESL